MLSLLIKQLWVVNLKNIKIRGRHYIISIIELIIPVLLFLFVAFTRSKLKGIAKEYIGEPTFIHHEDYYMQNLRRYDMNIYYSPRTTFTQNLMQELSEKQQIPSDQIKSFIDAEELLKYYNVHGSDITTYSILFNNLVNDGIPQHLSYNISVKDPDVRWPLNSLFASSHNYEPGTGSETYRSSGFIALQWSIDEAFIEIASNLNKLPYTITLQEFPYPPYLKDNAIMDIYTQVYPLVTCLSFMILCPMVLQIIVDEKSTGIKELMKIVGLKQTTAWIGWMCHGLRVNFFSIILITILMKFNIFSTEYPPIDHTSASVFFVSMILYCVASISLCCLLSTFFENSTIAVTFGIIFWILSYFTIPNFISDLEETSWQTWILKIVLCLFPNVAMSLGYKTIAMFEVREMGVQWDTLFESASHGKYDITLGMIFIMLFVDTILFLILSMYIEHIYPGKYGVAKPWHFPVSNNFKCIFKRNKKGPNKSQDENIESLYKELAELAVGIETKEVSKKYGRKLVLHNINYTAYQGEISVLLGHNGAGKSTLMSIVTGFLSPTSGEVMVNGSHISEISDKQMIGICPQHNMYFNDLTVEEHLIFFGRLKGIPHKTAKESAGNLLQKLELEGHKFAKTLSGGMKRKLNLAMALMGDPSIVILDEPTSGMDFLSRRRVWDLLLEMRHNKTIIVSTHFMEEAEVIGDRISIMNHGLILYSGTQMYLEQKLGAGYYITCKFDSAYSKQRYNETILGIIKCVEETDKEMAVYILPQCMKICFSRVLQELENFAEIVSIKNTTMNDIFINAGRNLNEQEIKNVDFEHSIEYETNHIQKGLVFTSKKLTLMKHFFYLYFGQILQAAGFILLALFLANNISYDIIKKNEFLNLNTSIYGDNTVLYTWNGQERAALADLLSTYKKTGKICHTKVENSANIHDSLIAKGKENILFYRHHLIVGAEFNATPTNINVNAMFSNVALHGAPISLNLATNTILKTTLNSSYHITVYNSPLPDLEKSAEEKSTIKIIMSWIFLYPLALILLTVPCIIYPFMERTSKVKYHQFMSGVSITWYWLTIYIMDLLMYIPTLLVIFIGIYLYYGNEETHIPSGLAGKGSLFLISSTYGLSSIACSYLFSYGKNLPKAISIFISSGFIIGSFGSIIVFSLKQNIYDEVLINTGKILGGLFILSPEYNLSTALINLMIKEVWKHNWNIKSPSSKLIACSFKLNPCCGEDENACALYQSHFHGEHNITMPIIYMIGNALLYFMIVIIINIWSMKGRSFLRMFKDCLSALMFNKKKIKPDKTGVPKHLNVEDISKYLVKKIKFIVSPGQCFGFLGANGAGKTTTFKMLSGEMLPNEGKINYGNISMENNLEAYRKYIGYCPQEDVLCDYLTCENMIKLFAILRNVKNVDDVTKSFLEKLGLKEYKNVLCKDLSGGNKRKLNFGMSILGGMEIILLDEPTTGVDPISRKKLCSFIKSLKKKKSQAIVLTSHSMDECELLCDRMGILLGGQMKDNKTIAELKNKYHSGFSVKFKLKPSKGKFDVDSLKKAVPERWNLGDNKRKVELIDEHSSFLSYKVDIKEQSKTWGKDLEVIEKIKDDFKCVEDYTVTEVTLEDVFLKSVKFKTRLNSTADSMKPGCSHVEV